MNKLRTGDEVIVISGKDRGKTGTLTKIKGDRCLVSGIKLVKKHVKPNPQINEPGGIIAVSYTHLTLPTNREV